MIFRPTTNQQRVMPANRRPCLVPTNSPTATRLGLCNSLPGPGTPFGETWGCHNNHINTMKPEQNGHHFADVIFKCIFFKESFCIRIHISFKFVPKGLIGKKSSLHQVMAWHLEGDKPLPEPMVTNFTDKYMHH